VLQSYLPAVVLVVLAIVMGGAFAFLNHVLGPRRPSKVKSDPYECGLPSEVKRSFRFGISFYLIAMMFLLFDVEVLFLFPIGVEFRGGGWYAVGAVGVFVFFLAVAFLYEWRRGGLDWRDERQRPRVPAIRAQRTAPQEPGTPPAKDRELEPVG
jgi:NADH-quinone oxidoreductase subunit A